jgi:integrase
MKVETQNQAVVVKRNGISVRIRPTPKNGKNFFVLDYWIKGQRRLVWRSSLADAKKAADDVFKKIADGQAESLLLRNDDRLMFLRARDAVAPIGKTIDAVCADATEIHALIAGRGITALEIVRDWLRRNKTSLPRITVADAGKLLVEQAKTDVKSNDRRKQLAAALDALALSFNVEVHTITPDQISSYLAALPFVDRTKKNHRATIGFFNRWLVLRGYLAKGTDWLENVQNYSGRKVGEIQIYSVPEITRLLNQAGDMTPFIAIGAFAGLRHAEIARLDWREIDLADGFIEVHAAKSKTGERRLVPMHDNLKAWLLPYRPKDGKGKVVRYANTTKQLLKIAAATKRDATANTPEIPALEWKHNALRHSFISYRVAETADVPRVADEAGNSPAIIRQHYLRRVKPNEAAEWFGITPLENTAAQCRTHRRNASTTLKARDFALAQNVRIGVTPVIVEAKP